MTHRGPSRYETLACHGPRTKGVGSGEWVSKKPNRYDGKPLSFEASSPSPIRHGDNRAATEWIDAEVIGVNRLQEKGH